MSKQRILLSSLALLAASATGAAHAARPGSGASSVPAPLCSAASVFVTYDGHGTAGFDGCASFSGNLTGNSANISGVESQIQSTLSLSVSYVGQSDGALNGPFTSNPGTASGTLVLDQFINGGFVIGLHGPDPGNQAGKYTLYGFDNPNHWTVASIHFDMIGTSVNNSGIAQNLSHAALYAGPNVQVVPPAVVPSVPEPGSMALLAAGLAGLGLVRRRTAAQSAR